MLKKPVGPGRTKPGQGTLGTFSGVFTPSILTILGIILFLRLTRHHARIQAAVGMGGSSIGVLGHGFFHEGDCLFQPV